MTRILHIETATEVCSASVSEGLNILSIRETHEPNSHSRKLTVFIDEILKETRLQVSDPDALALSMGPGSYTGLRIGASVIKGLAYGSGLPVIGIDTLEVLAAGLIQDQLIEVDSNEEMVLRPMIDARRMEVYTKSFTPRLEARSETEAVILEENSFADELAEGIVVFFGNGAAKTIDLIRHPKSLYFPDRYPSSRFMPAVALAKFD